MKTTNIKLLVMDVDGTLTDGKVYMGFAGEAVKAFDIKDGYGIANILPKLGITPVVITGRESEILKKRCRELKIEHVYQGILDKPAQLKKVMSELCTDACHVAYIGDDLNDLECMKLCGITACPSDAVDGVKKIADFCCTVPGGSGAVREFIDYLALASIPRMKKAFDFLYEIKKKPIEDGRYEIDGDKIYANVESYTTRDYENTRFESHRKYIDIQYMISGVEEMEVTEIQNLQIEEAYDTDRDVAFYKSSSKGERYRITDGQYLIFYPKDAHRPCITAGKLPVKVQKMVIKVAVDEKTSGLRINGDE